MMTMETRWQNAIKRAVEIDGEEAARYLGEGRFLIVSARDAGAYEVRLDVVDATPVTTCTCKSGEHGFPCWHQATARLIGGYADAPQSEPDDAAAVAAFLSNPMSIFESA